MAQISERQRRFAEAYLRGGDARAAARAAGYSPRYAAKALRTHAVRAWLEARRAGAPNPRAEPAPLAEPVMAAESVPLPDGRVASAREVLEYLTDVMRGEAEQEGRSGGASPRMKAAELLGKRLGVFNEAVEAPAAPVIIDDIPEPGDGA